MASMDELIRSMEANLADVRFADLCRVCDHVFGQPRQARGSHRIYRTPWPGNPRVNIQNERGKAKAYQVRQVLEAVHKLRKEERP